MRLHIFPLAVVLKGLVVLALAGCSSRPQDAKAVQGSEQSLNRYEYRQLSMGVQVRLVVFAPTEEDAFNACRAAYQRMAQINEAASDYKIDSELMRLCKKAGQGPVKVSDDLYTLLDRSVEVSRHSDGAFDCTVGPLVRLWRTARKSGKLPAPEEIDSARAKVGWQKIRLDPVARTAELAMPGMQLDMGGIAKGYAGDCVLQTLREHGITRALFEAGGDILLGDPPPGEKGWKIGVDGGADGPDQTLELSNCAVCTSGDTIQYVVIDGKRYSHIVDPRTGVGMTTHMLVSIITRQGIVGDALSTACDVFGPEKARELVKQYPGTTLHIRRPKD